MHRKKLSASTAANLPQAQSQQSAVAERQTAACQAFMLGARIRYCLAGAQPHKNLSPSVHSSELGSTQSPAQLIVLSCWAEQDNQLMFSTVIQIFTLGPCEHLCCLKASGHCKRDPVDARKVITTHNLNHTPEYVRVDLHLEAICNAASAYNPADFYIETSERSWVLCGR